MQFIDLVPDVYGVIFSDLNPYALSQVSRTSKHIRLNALTEALWKRHLENEFAWCTKTTGSAFEKYSACKRKQLTDIHEPEYRKLMLLVEAGHLEEIRVHLPKCRLSESHFKSLTLKNKSLYSLISEHPEQRIRDYFLKIMERCYPYFSDEFSFYLGRFEKMKPITADSFRSAAEFGGITCLDYIFQKKDKDFKLPHCLTDATKYGSLKKVKWLFDHGDTIRHPYCITTENSIRDATFCGNQEFLKYFIGKYDRYEKEIRVALWDAVKYWKFDALKVLLSCIPPTFTHLEYDFDFFCTTEETQACLKLLLDHGVTFTDPDDLYVARIRFPSLFQS